MATPTPQGDTDAADRWVEHQMFEEDVRAVLRMMRPHGRERLMGWREYRTGGKDFRVTVSWASEFEAGWENQALAVPQMTDVLEALLVGSVKSADDVAVTDEFRHYRAVIRELANRVDEMESRYT